MPVEFHGHLELWWRLVDARLLEPGGNLSVPRYCLVERPPARTLFPDAFKWVVGRNCVDMG